LPLIRLAVLDVDGTLKQAESPYQYLHQRLGVAHLAEVNRELALAGRISYGEWLRRDAALWAGQDVDHILRLQPVTVSEIVGVQGQLLDLVN